MKILSRRLCLGVLASALSVGAIAQANGFKKDGGHGKAVFHAKGPAGLNIDGSALIVVAQQEGEHLVFKADLQSVKTGIGMRDNHLKEALHAEKHKYAILRVEAGKIKVPDDNKMVHASTKGEFELNGTKKPVKFDYSAKGLGHGKYAVQGQFTIDYTKFNLEKQCYLKQCVDENVSVQARVKMKKD